MSGQAVMGNNSSGFFDAAMYRINCKGNSRQKGNCLGHGLTKLQANDPTKC